MLAFDIGVYNWIKAVHVLASLGRVPQHEPIADQVALDGLDRPDDTPPATAPSSPSTPPASTPPNP